MDFACLFHATLKKNWLTTYRCIKSNKVQLENNVEYDVVGVGDF